MTAIEEIKKALEAGPVGRIHANSNGVCDSHHKVEWFRNPGPKGTMLYVAPKQQAAPSAWLYSHPELNVKGILSAHECPHLIGDGWIEQPLYPPSNITALLARIAEGVIIIDAYALPTTVPLGNEVKIQRARQLDGSVLWAVRKPGAVLSRAGVWEWEPMPSSRDDEFLERCRFATAEEAIDAAMSSPPLGSREE